MEKESAYIRWRGRNAAEHLNIENGTFLLYMFKRFAILLLIHFSPFHLGFIYSLYLLRSGEKNIVLLATGKKNICNYLTTSVHFRQTLSCKIFLYTIHDANNCSAVKIVYPLRIFSVPSHNPCLVPGPLS